MNTSNKEWKPLTLAFNQDLQDALQQQHHAAQFIALVGRHLIPQQPDDSNTNMQYLPDQGLLAGNELINGMRLALQLTDLKLCFIDQVGNCKNETSLVGKSKGQIYKEIKEKLENLGIDVSKFKNELHYEIPVHKLDSGSSFSIEDRALFQENTYYRHNAALIMNNLVTLYPNAFPVRVWPHHFDTGTFIAVAHNEKGELSKSIGLGWAIPDSMMNEPYYYLSFWSEKPDEGLKTLPASKAGKWMMPDWNGAVLKHSEIQQQDSAEKQFDLVESFFHQGIDILMNR